MGLVSELMGTREVVFEAMVVAEQHGVMFNEGCTNSCDQGPNLGIWG